MSFVFKPSRIVEGKRVRSDLFSGRYAVIKGGRLVTVGLNTPDRETAEKRLRDIVIEKHREKAGIVASSAVRETATAPFHKLLAAYQTDLQSLGRVGKHVHDTMQRLRRVFAETRWRAVGDIHPDRFIAWRATLTCSAKTKKEYQISLNAFLNWLVDTDRLERNPLAKVGVVETRGKQVREARAFTEAELVRLFAIAGDRLLAYQTLLYTAQRYKEVRALVWGDLHFDGPEPYALFRASTTKDKDKRAVPLKRELADGLLAMRPVDHHADKRLFWWRWPTYDILRGDLKKAGIEHRDALGRVVHFHSFRKTWQTLGVRSGVNQRSAQEILGHSDANMTAQVYTDVPGLALHDEIAKFPWISNEKPNSQYDSQKVRNSGQVLSLAGIVAQLSELLKATGTEGISHSLASNGTSVPFDKKAARAGIEPVTK